MVILQTKILEEKWARENQILGIGTYSTNQILLVNLVIFEIIYGGLDSIDYILIEKFYRCVLKRFQYGYSESIKKRVWFWGASVFLNGPQSLAQNFFLVSCFFLSGLCAAGSGLVQGPYVALFSSLDVLLTS